MPKAISVENLSKAYQLGDFGTGTISRDVERFIAKILGKEDPYLRIGETNDRTVKGESDIVWVLKDLNFDIEQGDAVGIIGRNGAGKSTLLKVLSRITAPTNGSVKVKGRIASLLEVGTGFHPELTGRENIYLNGAILGMRKTEIKRRFDEIVDFSGVERYIDTPVKRYSSGMYVRLAFAVAAHLESEILIVDEVLAVGDAEFQKKCLGKLGDVSTGEGRTVLFVSHNMGSIRNLCKKVIILNNGNLVFNGSANEGIKSYLNDQSKKHISHYTNNGLQNASGFSEIRIENNQQEVINQFGFDEAIYLAMKLNIGQENINSKISVRVTDYMDRIIFTTERDVKDFMLLPGELNLKVKMPAHTLVPNKYTLTIALHIPNVQIIDLVEEKLSFEVIDTVNVFYNHQNQNFGCVFINCEWN